MLTSPNAGVGWKKIHESAIIFCWKHFVAMGNEGRQVLDFVPFFFFWFCSLFFPRRLFLLFSIIRSLCGYHETVSVGVGVGGELEGR